jgi:predicted peroxiredoxin
VQRRKLIFFAGEDPANSTRPAFMAYHFATVAHRAGLESEVRLAGDAVEILKEGGVPDPEYNKRLLNYMHEAVESGLFVSV